MISILNYYDNILNRNHISPASYFEWNTYRVFHSLGGYNNLIPNFKFDSNGKPLGCAKQGLEDIFIEYNNLNLLVECSLRSGISQVDTEGNSVYRHNLEKSKSCNCKCISLFISPSIHDELYLYYSHRSRAKIVPLSLSQFKTLCLYLKDKNVEYNISHILNNLVYFNNFNSPQEWKIEIDNYINSLITLKKLG